MVGLLLRVVYTNFKTFTPETHKTGLVKSLLFYSFSLCSDFIKLPHEIDKLKTVLVTRFHHMISRKIYWSCFKKCSFITWVLYLADFNPVACDFVRFHLIVIVKQNVNFSLVFDNSSCISQNVGRTEIKLVTSITCISYSLNYDLEIDLLHYSSWFRFFKVLPPNRNFLKKHLLCLYTRTNMMPSGDTSMTAEPDISVNSSEYRLVLCCIN